MTDQTTPRFDKLWHDAEKAHRLMIKRTRTICNAARLWRCQTYRFVKAFIQMNTHYHNELLDAIKESGQTFDQWMDDRFEVIEQLGDTRGKLMAAIDDGLTEKEYVEGGSIVLFRRSLTLDKPAVDHDAPLPETPSKAAMTAAEAIESLVSFKSRYQALRREWRATQQALAAAERRIDQLERTIKRIDQAASKAIA